MAVANESSHLIDTLKVVPLYHAPGGTAAVDVTGGTGNGTWLDMRDYGSLLIGILKTVGTGAVNSIKVLGNTASDGSGTDFEIKTKTPAAALNAVGEYAFVEIRAEDLRQGGANYRYVALNVTLATGTDTLTAVYIFGEPRWAQKTLSADSVS